MNMTTQGAKIFEVLNDLATLEMTKIDAGDRHALNALENAIHGASRFLEKLQFGNLKP